MAIKIGEVISVRGISVTLRVFEESNRETLFFKGDKYKGLSIREYISIQRGFTDIICTVEGEYLDEMKIESKDKTNNYVRKVDVKPIGYIQEGIFYEGVKFLPMIKDPAYLLVEDSVSKIFNRDGESDFVVGEMLKEGIPVSLPWKKLFNTHIGIFGNTGSGKSNTLAKLYTTLFHLKKDSIVGKSKFVIIDFNGEYCGQQIVTSEFKKIIELNTLARNENNDKFPLVDSEFWNIETMSILFQATLNTQRPFLNRVITGREKYLSNPESLINYTKSIFRRAFSSAAPKPECLDLLRKIASLVDADPLLEALKDIEWFNGTKFKGPGPTYYEADGTSYERTLRTKVDQIDIDSIDHFDELILRINIQLASDLLNGFVQFDHIQPLLKRMDSSLTSLKKVIEVTSSGNELNSLTVISLRKCNREVKKVLPLLIAKHFYELHKLEVTNPPDKTMHLIIDEAHNILSQQSSGESESWKDYRLDLFEEIIKEGRKFGMFLTLSSQRPADISPTIMSQIHNFFIHRLVNDKDLFLLDNTISTLDNISKKMIPNLSQGSCVVTGTSFTLPMLLQVDLLDKVFQPDSEDVDLEELWGA